MLKETNTPTRPRIEPGSPDPESDALTIRPVRPPVAKLRTGLGSAEMSHLQKFFWGGGGQVGRGDVRGVGSQGGCEQRIEVFVKIKKKKIYIFFF